MRLFFKRKFLVLSLLVHVTLLALIFIWVTDARHRNELDAKGSWHDSDRMAKHAVISHLVSQPPAVSNAPSAPVARVERSETRDLSRDKPQVSLRATRATHTENSKQAPVARVQRSETRDLVRTKSRATHRENSKHKIAVLLSVLHRAIANAQQFPEEARVLSQQGRVQIGFLLHANGELTEITIRRSSGYAILDKAALDAVQRISPIAEAKQYLTREHYFVVNVIFSA